MRHRAHRRRGVVFVSRRWPREGHSIWSPSVCVPSECVKTICQTFGSSMGIVCSSNLS